MPRLNHILLALMVPALLLARPAFAQAPNDDFENAAELIISENGYGIGIFYSDPVTVDDGSVQPGEYTLPLTPVTRTFWHRFTLPTPRLISLSVEEVAPPDSDNIINAGHLGLVIFPDTNVMPFPGDTALSFTETGGDVQSWDCVTPLQPGSYLVQTFATSLAEPTGVIQLKLGLAPPSPETLDHPEFAYDFGTVSAYPGDPVCTYQHNIPWDCKSMDDEAERMPGLGGPDSAQYRQSVWFRFTTGDHIDGVSIYHGNVNLSGDDYSCDNDTVGFRVFEGVPDAQNLESATLLTAFKAKDCWNTNLECVFEPNTEYSIQVITHDDQTLPSTFRLTVRGTGTSSGPTPDLAGQQSDAGLLTPSIDGEAYFFTDHLDCASRFSPGTASGPFQPDSAIGINGFPYDMSVWFPFQTDVPTNMAIYVDIVDCSWCPDWEIMNGHPIRVFNLDGPLDATAVSDSSALLVEGYLDHGDFFIPCLPAGSFAIQVLGRSKLGSYDTYGCHYQFGKQVEMTLTLYDTPEPSYTLSTPGDVDWINGGVELSEGVTHAADTSWFTCTKTLLPSGADSLFGNPIIPVDRAIYRSFTIGADAEGLGGHLEIHPTYGPSPFSGGYQSLLFRGDADALATDQNVVAWPDSVQGLIPIEGPPGFTSTQWSKFYCLTPDTYTLATFGDSLKVGAATAPNFTFNRIASSNMNPDDPEDLGDIIAQGMSVSSMEDTFSCAINPVVIDMLPPPTGYDKLLYREFQLSEDAEVTIQARVEPNLPHHWYYERFRVFSGRVSDVGTDGLTLAPFHKTTDETTHGQYSIYQTVPYSTPPCGVLNAGWYTVVSYGKGANYGLNSGDAAASDSWVGKSEYITVTADTNILPGPFFHRPHLTCDIDSVANNGSPLTWDNSNGSDSIPWGATSYTGLPERFKAQTDSLHIHNTLPACDGALRASYYRFSTDDTYHARILGVKNFHKQLFALDALTTDSLLLATSVPLADCQNDGNDIEICALDAGAYTLVVYGMVQDSCDVSFTPQILLQPTHESRFDLFENAYDFGTIPGDGLPMWGAEGDLHPDFPSLAPSNDHFTCRTGWEPFDPQYYCSGVLSETADASDTLTTDGQHAYFQSEATNESQNERRSLWYSFAALGKGMGTITVNTLSGPRPFMALYRADAFADLPDHASIVSLGSETYEPILHDSLTFVVNNHPPFNSCQWNASATMSWDFTSDPCNADTTLHRYFLIVDFREHLSPVNGQIEISVAWNAFPDGFEDPKYDFIQDANWVGDGEDLPPYTQSPLEPNVMSSGAWGPLKCATADASDASVGCGGPIEEQKSLWYAFEVPQAGHLHIATEVEAGTGYSPSSYSRYLVRALEDTATIVSSSGSTGLQSLLQGSAADPINATGDAADYEWRRWCVEPGLYYYLIKGCYESGDTSEVRPHILLESIPGDFCSTAIGTSGSTVGTYSVSAPASCLTFGTDFGEDGENEACLSELDLVDPVSIWFQFDYTGMDSVTISFSLGAIPSGVNAEDIRYRIFYGQDCTGMIASSYCQNNPLIQECVTQDNGHFIVQVVYPGSSSGGNIGFNFEVQPSNNPDCAPFNPFLLDADFNQETNCLGDSIIFTNLSTSGATIEYAWDFGFAGPEGTSSEDNPVVAFPDSGTYDVSLLVSNPNTGDDTTFVSQVSVTASGAPIDLPDSLFACAGDIATVEAPLIPNTLYDWSTGDVGLSVQTGTDGFVVLDYTVFTSFGQCLFKDSTHVSFAEVTAEAGLDQGLCQGDSTVHGVTVPPDVTLITWTAPDASVVSTADTVLLTQPGWYVLQQEGPGCIRRDSLLVDVVDPTFDLGPDLQACLGETVDIAGPDAPGMVHLWTDGSAGTTATFSTTGVHGLTVDLLGCTHTDSVALEIIDLTFGLPAASSFCLGESTAFSASGLPVHELAVWTEPDAATVASTDIDFDQVGAYTLTLSRAGCSETETIDVTEVDLTFDLGPNDTLCMGETVLLDPVVPAGVGYTWSTGATTPTLAVDATLDVELVIDSLGCTSADSVHLFQQDLAFALTPDSTICLGDSLQVEPVTLPPYAVDFSWSGGATSAAITVSTAGPHTLTIADASTGCSGEATMDLTLHVVEPVLNIPTLCLWDTAAIIVNGVDSLILQAAYPDAASTAPLAWEAHPDSTSTYQWVAHDWQCSVTGETTVEVVYAAVPAFPGFDTLYCFNEAAQPLPATPLTSGDFTWTATGGLLSDIDPADLQLGNHTLDYTYTDDANGCPDTASVTLTVVDTLDVAFLSGFPELCLQDNPLPLPGFVDLPGGTFTTNYLGGAPSLTTSAFEPQLVTPLLAAPEAFAVQYALENAEGCTSTIEQTVTVHPHPVADFTVSDDCLYNAVDAVNTSTVAGSTLDSAAWILDGLGTLNDPLPDDVFWAAPGTYGLSLTVTSSIGCSSTQSTTVTAHPVPVAAFDWTGHCTNEPVVFTESSTVSSGSVTGFNWSTNGAPWTAVSQPDSIIATPGQHDIVLVVASDFGCLDTVVHTIPMDPAPVADFTADDVCDEEPVTVLPSASVSSGTITSMMWSLDGNAPFAGFSGFDLLMAGPGDYALQQFVTSDMGCSDSLVQSITVYPLPAVAFDVEPDACLGSTFDLLSTSTVEAPQTLANQSWLLSNGVAFTGTFSTQPADALGEITVSLVVTTNLGCSSALTVEDAIEVHPSPVAGFDLGVEVVPFTHAEFEVLNQSSPDAVEWLYIMGDGTVYDEEAPEHQYDDYGVFEVTQIATNAYGCSDQVTHPIEVLPDFLVYVPTAFTPDNDGVNDIWKPVIEGVREIIEYRLIIFDRWGDVLFESDNPDDGWIGNDKDGTHFVRDGVYSYRLVVRAERAQLREEFGSITIVR